jgi:hypothetical protein
MQQLRRMQSPSPGATRSDRLMVIATCLAAIATCLAAVAAGLSALAAFQQKNAMYSTTVYNKQVDVIGAMNSRTPSDLGNLAMIISNLEPYLMSKNQNDIVKAGSMFREARGVRDDWLKTVAVAGVVMPSTAKIQMTDEAKGVFSSFGQVELFLMEKGTGADIPDKDRQTIDDAVQHDIAHIMVVEMFFSKLDACTSDGLSAGYQLDKDTLAKCMSNAPR